MRFNFDTFNEIEQDLYIELKELHTWIKRLKVT